MPRVKQIQISDQLLAKLHFAPHSNAALLDTRWRQWKLALDLAAVEAIDEMHVLSTNP